MILNSEGKKINLALGSESEINQLYEHCPRLKKDKIPMTNIKVIGVGGAGNSTIRNFIRTNSPVFDGIMLISVNTDLQDLRVKDADIKVQIGEKKSGGLGSGTDPEIGLSSAMENASELREILKGTKLLFLTCGMGGGTGTGATPFIAQLAKEMNILTVAVVSTPFNSEGASRLTNAMNGIKRIENLVDVLLIVPNQKLLELNRVTINQAFDVSDNELKTAITSISSLLVKAGDINVDFADLKKVIENKKTAHMGIGKYKGPIALYQALNNALTSPLLGSDIKDAEGLIISFDCNGDYTYINDMNDAIEMVKRQVNQNCNTVWGYKHCKEMAPDEVIATLIATGIKRNESIGKYKEESVNEQHKSLEPEPEESLTENKDENADDIGGIEPASDEGGILPPGLD